MTKTPYWQKLQDPRWQRRRLVVMERAAFKCEECGSGEAMLTVHHSYYQRGVEPWDYPDESLHCLCSGCHEERAQAERELLNNIGTWKAGEISRIAEALKFFNTLCYNPYPIGDCIVNFATDDFQEMISADYDNAHALPAAQGKATFDNLRKIVAECQEYEQKIH